jgi:Leucine-rich repeat (LRR) protein
MSVLPGLTGLQTLYLSDNQIASLPRGAFSDLTSLKYLSLSSNQIATLPSGIFSGLTSVRSLDLSRNMLTCLPEIVIPNAGPLHVAIGNLDNDELNWTPQVTCLPMLPANAIYYEHVAIQYEHRDNWYNFQNPINLNK